MENFFQPAIRKIEPDWFRLGRDAARVMEQLNGMKELDFYLRHPEPFIRLQAIRRVAILLLPDAIPSLGKMLDDPIENEQNRDEAGWAIRRISRAKGLSWFARSPYTDKYDGTEPPSVRFGITVLPDENQAAAAGPVGFDEDARLEDEVLLRIQMDEKGLEVAFSPIHWIAANFRHLAMDLVKGILLLLKGTGLGLLHLAGALGKGVAAGSRRVFHHMAEHAERFRNAKAARTAAQSTGFSSSGCPSSVLPATAPAAIWETGGHASQTAASESALFSGTAAHASPNLLAGNPVFSGSSDKPVLLIGLEEAISSGTVIPQNHAMRTSSQFESVRTTAAGQNSSSLLGNALSGKSRHAASGRPAYRRRKEGNTMFRLLFYPVRLVKAHWLFTLAVLVVFYSFLGFTHAGRFVMSRLNPAVLWTNDRFVAVTKLAFMDFFDMEVPNMPADVQTGSAPTAGAEVAQASAGSTPGELSELDNDRPRYRVTASKGLSLRSEPSKTASRIILMSIGTNVTYEGERDKDADAGEWMKVSVDGRTGWAMAQWLESVPDADEDGGSDGNP